MRKRAESEQLGLDLGTATNQLKRKVMWVLLEETRRDVCFRCKTKMSEDTFSLDHRNQWLHESPNLFWDLDNVTFSHKTCNTRNRRYIKTAKHGGITMYKTYGCRCLACKEAWVVYSHPPVV